MSLEQIIAGLVEKVERRYYGKHRGLVVDNADPEQLGRLRLQVPSVLGASVVTGWALPCVPYGGDAGQGFLFIPEVGAGVWVEFEEGDLEFPLWSGAFWSRPGGDSELPKPNKADGSEERAAQDPPTRKIIKTKAGHTIQLEDASGGELITIVDGANGHVIVLDASGITLEDKVGGNKIELNKGGVTITASTIKLGGGANEGLVLGKSFNDALQQFISTQLQTHQHVATSIGAPTTPPSSPFSLTVPLSKHLVES